MITSKHMNPRVAWLLTVLGGWLWAGAAWGMTADEAVALALERSEAVAQAEAQVQAAEGQQRATAFLRQDPVLTGSLAVVGEMASVALLQPVSLSGEGLAAHQAAKAERVQATAQVRRTRLQVAARTRAEWAHAVEARAQRALLHMAWTQAQALSEAATLREAAGSGSMLSVRLARLHQAEAYAQWSAAVAAEARWTAALAAGTGTPVQDLSLPDDPLLAAPVRSERSALGEVVRSDVQAADAGAQAAQSRVREARAAVLPAVGLGGFVEQEDGEFRAGPRVQLTVPLWNRNQAGRAAALGAAAAAKVQAQQTAARARSEQSALASAYADLRQDSAQPFHVPAEARAALLSVTAGVEAGELDMTTAALLRSEIVRSQAAWLAGRRVHATVQIEAALAVEDVGLLGGD